VGACARDGPQFEPHPPDHFPAPPHEPAPPWIEGSEVGTGHGPIFERALKQTANHLTRRARTPDEKARAGSPPGERLCRNPRAMQCAQERSLARETPRPRFVRACTNTHREAGRDPSAGTCTPQPPEEKPPTAQNWPQAAATPPHGWPKPAWTLTPVEPRTDRHPKHGLAQTPRIGRTG
jgi:hypothetical protein